VYVVSNSMSILQVGDNVLTDPVDIEAHVLSYFQSIFSVDNNCGTNNMVERLIPSLVTSDDNDWLYHNGDGAPGPDCFGGDSYQNF